MKFRGKIVDIVCIQQFTNIVGTISKLVKTCIMRITEDKVFFILSERIGDGGAQMWCELDQSHFFDEYAMDGVSAEANEIYLEVMPDLMLKALKTAHSAKWIKLKLTKKNTPCLTMEIDLPTGGPHQRQVVHDIPVNVVPRKHWPDYTEPEMPKFDVSITMPQLKLMKNVIDKMKNLSNYLSLSANRSGEMKLSVETDMVAVSTHFQNLLNPTWGNQDGCQILQSSQGQEEFATARIDIRKFAQFLNGQQVNPKRVICNIVHHRMVHFFLMHEDLSLQYFLPVISR
ncbi:checkpoint protein hus1 [Biomphalaria glabrata]|uniref:Checkpoint protein n=2 Tax=Biomphalaria glabrata TaxID=6526 RepID=A0A9W2YFH7_BIOGL|nr:checkpoint protein HUS1-like isoform X1 [Biomphalaria glabrata]KAI8749235.1 checkpoint protein HUS1 isoform X1 [Biomphalaria glabrata]KAI8753779.1 checkpoint protein HUS1-like isoform X1 [Biomphalaria glabrata]